MVLFSLADQLYEPHVADDGSYSRLLSDRLMLTPIAMQCYMLRLLANIQQRERLKRISMMALNGVTDILDNDMFSSILLALLYAARIVYACRTLHCFNFRRCFILFRPSSQLVCKTCHRKQPLDKRTQTKIRA